jgi:hypothetical protein
MKRPRTSYKLFSVTLVQLQFLALATVLVVAVSGCSKTATAPAPQAEKSPAPTAPHVESYTTNFPSTEKVLSDGDRWISGKTVGVDWGYVSATPGYAFGTAGPKRFADSVALLKGNWGPNQTAEAVVRKVSVHGYPEVSLRLRSSLSEHDCSGYEISDSLRDKDPYLIIVRWNGPLADFTYLLNVSGEKYRVTTGDVMKATIVGNVITAYKNGVEIGHVKDNTYLNGLPGFGFNEGRNGNYGITRFSVAATDASGSAALLPAPVGGQ